MNMWQRGSFILMLIGVFGTTLPAQVSPYVMEIRPASAVERTPLTLSASFTSNTQLQRVQFHYRQFGESEFKQQEMLLSGQSAVITIPANVITPPYIEYYLELFLNDGSKATFPTDNPDGNPSKLPVQAANPKEQEIRFLSPEPGETVTAEDLGIAISLMFASDAVDKRKTKLYLDNVEVTKDAVLSDDVLLYRPQNFDKPLSLGSHTITVELRDTLGRMYYTTSLQCNLSTALAMEEAQSLLQYNANGQLEYRNEKIDTTKTTYLRGDLHAGATYKSLIFGGDLHLTNEDKPDRQPQNRYLATVQAADVLKLQAGDAYPVFPSLIISGLRVRGVTGSLKLGFFNLDISAGQTYRAIEGNIIGDTTYGTDTSAWSARPKNSIHNPDSTNLLAVKLFNAGTYAQNILAIRPSFGSGENFQLGFCYLKAKDDMSSIQYGTYPKENLVMGTDLLLAFDNQHIKWFTQTALSLSNNDISPGSFTDIEIDSLEGVYDTTKNHAQAVQDANNLKKVASVARNFITINADLFPLNPSDGLPSLAVESELSLNYFNNFFRAMAFRRGNAYQSFGNEYVQTDIEGLNVSDRVRFWENRILASVSFETKWNNISNNGATPQTTFNTFNSSITAYPGANLPGVTLGYGFYTRKDPIDLAIDTTHIDSLYVADELTNRYYLSLNQDFQWGIRHSISVTASIADKTDNTFYKRNQNNMNVAFSWTGYYKIPLQTSVSVIVCNNASYSAVRDTITNKYLAVTTEQDFNYSTISVNARYRLFQDRLSVLATFAPSFGDFKRTLFHTGIDYEFVPRHSIAGQMDYINNPDRASDVIASVIYRFSF
ncbi:MAG TPA: hypothetical protein VMU30_00985 [Bacteroidota bacterium]|nr:hypothetical protein [Bacteroidota bacterium]